MLIDGPAAPRARYLFAHGAGAPMDTPFMNAIAEGLSANKIQVIRFEFAYMAKRRDDGKRRGPDRMPVLLEAWRTALDGLSSLDVPTLIGGKSMGGRAAATYAAEPDGASLIDGVICLGYPFHPPGKPEKTRIEHLAELKTPAMFLQGTRDTLGGIDEVSGYPLSKKINIHWLEDGDHGLKPRKKSGRTEEQNWAEALDAFTAFAEKR